MNDPVAQNEYERLPYSIRLHCRENYGNPIGVKRLRGLSRNQLWLVQFNGQRVVLKANRAPLESNFYMLISPHLVTAGVAVPQVFLKWTDENLYWLVLEYIPRKLDRSEWLANAEMLKLLHHLHQCRQDIELAGDKWFQPAWTDDMTEEALSHFSAETRQSLMPTLRHMQQKAQSLFEPRCWISGDPNPMNWGRRADGALVLFDWERFGRGAPALDLAITVPGLGTRADFLKVASVYLATDNAEQADEQRLADEMGMAKLWSVVELLSNAKRGQVGDLRVIAHLVDALPIWVTKLPESIRHAM